MSLLTQFEGRISRKSFWFGILAIIGLVIVLSWAALPYAISGGFVSRLVLFLSSLVILYPIAALVIKRLHDRDKLALPLTIVFLAPGIVANLLRALNIGYETVELGGQQIMVPGAGAYVLGLVTVAAAFWMIVELGFLKGTTGENRFGDDPLVTPRLKEA